MSVTYFFMSGGGVGITPDGTVPVGAVVCTVDQYLNSRDYVIDSAATPPSIVAAPASTPTAAQQASVMMATGLTVVGANTPALNGTFSVDQLSQMDIIAVETSINAGKGFPGGATTFSYPDTAGVMRSFSASDFTNFAAAVRDYVYALRSVIAGASTTLPAASVTIA